MQGRPVCAGQRRPLVDVLACCELRLTCPPAPQVHVHFKPPFSFSCLIFMSIEDSPQKAMPVKEIYNWIQEHFPFYQAAPIGWKNSVRHNLSLNKCFRKVEKSPVSVSGGRRSGGRVSSEPEVYRTDRGAGVELTVASDEGN